MTAIGELNVVPVRKGSISEEIAKAIDAFEPFDIVSEATPVEVMDRKREASHGYHQ